MAALDTLIGGKGDDVLLGRNGSDRIEGRGGDDILSGGAGNDDIAGGAGNDTIAGGSGDDELAGGAGNDALDGGDGADALHGGAGNDSLAGGAGNDELGGGAGDDVLAGGAGDDEVRGGDGDDTVLWRAGDGNDVVRGGEGTDTFVVTTSDTVQQTVRVTAASNGRIVVTVEGDGGGVVVLNSIEDLQFVVGLGGATIVVGDGVALPPLDVSGSDGANVIDQSGTTQSASIDAGAGNDVVLAGDAADTIGGGAGDDRIDGGGGADVVDAGSGNDEIVWAVGDGNDVVQGGDDIDELELSLSPGAGSMLAIAADAAGNVILTSSSGEQLTADGIENIVVNAAAGGSTVTIGDLAGTDVAQNTVHFVGDAGVDVLDASATDRRVDAQGNGGNDTLLGGSAGDLLAGGADDDALHGNDGDDVLDGGAGNDAITGGAGNDLLTGGAGADRYFVVDPGQSVVAIGNDTITDFEANDVIDLTPVASITSLALLQAAAQQDGADTVIDLGGGSSIRLAGVSLSNLTAANFVFATPPIVGTANADVLQGTAGDDRIFGLGGDDVLIGRAGSDVLDGGDGLDAAGYTVDTGAIVANLSATAITVAGVTVEAHTVRDATGSTDTLISIEALIGSNHADTLVGGDGSDTLSGLGGADTIDGGAGNDIISGGGGSDALDGGVGFDVVLLGGPAALGAPLANITLNPDGSVTSVDVVTGETQTAVNFELVFGSLGNDTINGTGGNDFLGGSFGSDVIDGGAGIDTVVYTFNPGTVLTIDLASGTSAESFTPFGPPGLPPPTFTAADTLLGIENVRGSASGETIIGNGADNVLEGGAGNDLLRGGAGNDTLNGGASLLLTHPEAVIPVELDGTDTADYSVGAVSGVSVDLLTGIATDGAGGTDTLLSIENVNGSMFADTIVGDDGANVLLGLESGDTLRGNAGADTIDGGGGNDFITGGAGDDTLTGGTGADRYFLIGPGETVVAIGHDTITDFVPGDVIDLTPVASLTTLAQVLAASRQEGTDTVIDLGSGNTIRLAGVAIGSLTAGSFVFAGGPQFPPGSIVGTNGNDVLPGTPGNDVFFGLGGSDFVLAGTGSDTIDGGDGVDTVAYSAEPGPLVVNLSSESVTVNGIVVEASTVRDVTGGVDTLVNVENVSITTNNFADTLIGSAGSNQLAGGSGADTIFGGDGHDTISGGAGIDVLDGGAGFDIVLFSGDPVPNNGPGLQITVNADGTITAVGATGTEANLPNFEMVSGSQGNDFITGNAGDNMLGGGFGSDIIDGGAGVDTVNYQFNIPSAGSVLTVDLAAGTSFETLTTPITPIPGIPTQTFTASDTLINVENVSGTTGVDHLFGDAGDNVLQGFLGDDRLRGGAGNDTLDGNVFTLFTHLQNTGPSPLDGSDTADYSTDPNGVDVDLATGVATDGFGDTDTLVSIENVTGSAFADTIVGDGGANLLEGLAGADTLRGGAGDDRLIGGAGLDVVDGGDGFDVVDFSADASGLDIAISGTTVTAVNAALESESATNVEAVIGSTGDDVVVGDDGDNLLIAGSGDDVFDGNAGADTVRFDTAVVVDLAAGTAQSAGTLALQDVENVTASASADVLRGSAADNVLIGGLGDDVLMGRGGADTLIGGAAGVASTDIDTADYSEDGGSVSVNLAAGTAVDGSGASDTLVAIERVVGSQFADTLIGDGGNNVLTGLGGDDSLTGGAGVDTFVMTADAAGNAAFGNDTVTDFNVAQDVVSLRAFPAISFADLQALSAQDGADAVIAVDAGHSIRLLNVDVASLTASNFLLLSRNIIGTDAAETLTGDVGDDDIQGRGGNDTLLGLDGNDRLDGGLGADTLNGGPGDDVLLDQDAFGTTMIGGAGNDSITGGTPDYATDPAAIIANLSTSRFDVEGDGSLIVAARTVRDGYGGTDTLAGTIGTFEASYFSDTVVGGGDGEQFFLWAGDDRVLGGDGSDGFHGGSGADFIDGGAGFDTLNYTDLAEDGGPAAPTQGIRLNLSDVAVDIGGGVVLAANGGTDQYGHRDTVFNIESVNGSRFGDVIIGSTTTSSLSGNDGDDTLLGGAGHEFLFGGRGNDLIDGGAGTDSVSFSGTTGAVVNLLTQTASDGFGGTDIVRNVEVIFGGQFADDLTGDDNGNSLLGDIGDDTLRGNGGSDSLGGGDGNDVLEGGAGDDSLNGDRNNDLLTGGAGQDFFTFTRNVPPTLTDFGNDTVTDFSVADDVLNVSQVPELTSLEAVQARATANPQGVLITINAASSIQLNGLTLADLPLVRFIFSPIGGTPGDDVLDGTNGNDNINGLAGNDTINGRGGSDFIDGGDGNDTLNGGDDADQLRGGIGNDVLNGEAGNDFLEGGSGNDTVSGGLGSDTFRASTSVPGAHGRDVYADFSVADDRLDLGGIASMTSRDALNAAAQQVGADVVITIDPTSSITLRNFTLAELATANVSFAPLNGTPGNDVLNGSSGADTMNGFAGDDVLSGLGGHDFVSGGDGNDDLTGGDGDDTLLGDLGNDVLRGDDGRDFMHGGGGDDTLSGGDGGDYFNMREGGNDVVTDFGLGLGDTLDLQSFATLTSRAALAAVASQAGPDVVITTGPTSSITLQNFTLAELALANVILAPLNGTPGDDNLSGTDDGEVIDGLGGDDVIDGLGGGDSVFGSGGNDTLRGGADGDYVSGGDGNDTLFGDAGFDTVEGGPGNDSLTGGADTDFFRMSSGHDRITDFEPTDVLLLTPIPTMTTRAALEAAAEQVGPDVVITIDASNTITLESFTLAQLAASDVRFAPIVGTSANDTLNGSEGNDVINGGGGDDLLNGAEGDDQLFGEEGNDVLNGGAGGDNLVAGPGNDTIDGGDSLNDFVDFEFQATSGAVVDLAAGVVANDGTGGTDEITNVEHVYGTSFGDSLAGDAGGNQLHGFLGNDTLSGRGGVDNVHGYDGDDILTGGTGDDFLTGGAGDDLFVFAAGDGFDTIGDFSAGAGTDDVIDLQALASFETFADVQAATTDNGSNATIDLGGGNQITLLGVTASALHADDFLL